MKRIRLISETQIDEYTLKKKKGCLPKPEYRKIDSFMPIIEHEDKRGNKFYLTKIWNKYTIAWKPKGSVNYSFGKLETSKGKSYSTRSIYKAFFKIIKNIEKTNFKSL